MKKTYLAPIVLLTATLVAYAGGPKAQKLSIDITEPTTVAGVQLKPGVYKVQLSADNTEATFYKGSTEVAKAVVHSQSGAIKFVSTQLSRTENTLKGIQVGGTTTDLIIDGPAKAGAANGSR